MRRQLCQELRTAFATTRPVTSSPSAPRSFSICASCSQKYLAQPTSHTLRQRPPPRSLRRPIRSISTTPSLQSPPPTSTPAAKTPTYYALFPQTFPAGAPPRSPFSPNLSTLRREFLTLQAKLHPDLAAPADKARAEAQSAAVNDAYRTIRDPLRRAEYLLRERDGVGVDDESAKLEYRDDGDGGGGEGEEGMLLMEVMEAREAVEEAEDEAGLEVLKEENERRVEGSVAVLEEGFEKGDWEVVKRETVRLRYWRMIEESIKEWEGGKR